MPDAQVSYGPPQQFREAKVIHGDTELTGTKSVRTIKSGRQNLYDQFTVVYWVIATGYDLASAPRTELDPTGQLVADEAAELLADYVENVIRNKPRLDLGASGLLGLTEIASEGPSAIVGPQGENGSAVKLSVTFTALGQ
jgi:hypothetical protein